MADYLTRDDVDNDGPELINVTQRAALQALSPHLTNLQQQNAELQQRLAVDSTAQACCTRGSRCDFGDHTEPDRVVIASGDYCCPRRRAQRGRVEIGVAQPTGSDAVHREPPRSDGTKRDRCASGARWTCCDGSASPYRSWGTVKMGHGWAAARL